MINKRQKRKLFEGLGIPVPSVGCASNDTSHPETLRVPTMRCSQRSQQECLYACLPPCPGFGGADLLPRINLSGLLPLKEDFSSIKTLAFLFLQQQLCPSEPQ